MNITAQMVKELREKTGAGMMDCKKALQEAEGDMNTAQTALREKGLAKAQKKAGRSTSEGVIVFATPDGGMSGALFELKCETDFVARNDQFVSMANSMAQEVAANGTLPANAEEEIKKFVGVIGENIQPGRQEILKVQAPAGLIGSYIHANGKIGVMVELRCTKPEAAQSQAMADLGKNIAMQVAAVTPLSVSPEDLPQENVEQEKAIFLKQAQDEGKPEHIAEKIVEGRIKKFYKEVCLVEQPYIKDDSKTIRDLLQEVGKELGDTITIGSFVRLGLGEDHEEETE
ncbi:MAG: translation elongation factor Ts [Thermodesulfobacteriota bacterium]